MKLLLVVDTMIPRIAAGCIVLAVGMYWWPR